MFFRLLITFKAKDIAKKTNNIYNKHGVFNRIFLIKYSFCLTKSYILYNFFQVIVALIIYVLTVTNIFLRKPIFTFISALCATVIVILGLIYLILFDFNILNVYKQK